MIGDVTHKSTHAFSLSGSERDPASFGLLYERLQPSLLRYLVRLTGDGDAAEDVVQEAFLRLLRRPDLRDDDARLWLFTVATNLVRDRGRSIARRSRLLAGAAVAPPAGELPDRAAERAEEVERVRAALELLSERDRQMLLMREEGFRYEEIAQAVGVATSSVGTLMARALKRFASVYRRETEDDDPRG